MLRRAGLALVCCLAFGCGRVGYEALRADDAGAGGDGGAGRDSGPAVADPVAYFSCDSAIVGGVVPDESGNGNDGACVDCPAVVPGRIGNACEFDSNDDDHILIASGPDFEGASELSLALWVNLSDAMGYRSFLSKPFGAQNENSWQLEVTLDCPGNAQLAFITSGFRRSCHDQSPPVGDWAHIAGTWDGQTQRLYVDGAEIAPVGQTSLELDASDIVFGADYNAGSLTNQTEGLLDEVYIFDRVLDPGEVATLATP